MEGLFYSEGELISISGAAAIVCMSLDAASDEEGLKVRNTKRLGHSLRETSRNTRKELQQIITASDDLPQPGKYAQQLITGA